MLNILIPYIDTKIDELGYFSQLKGLAEKINENTEENPKSFPGVYEGAANYSQINLEAGICYHRINGNKVIAELENEVSVGCAKAILITYPMVLIGCLNKDRIPNYCAAYLDDLISNSVGFKINTINFKSVKSSVKAYDIETAVKSITTDKQLVWNGEYENVKFEADYQTCYFKVEYDLSIKAQDGCLNIINCQ